MERSVEESLSSIFEELIWLREQDKLHKKEIEILSIKLQILQKEKDDLQEIVTGHDEMLECIAEKETANTSTVREGPSLLDTPRLNPEEIAARRNINRTGYGFHAVEIMKQFPNGIMLEALIAKCQHLYAERGEVFNRSSFLSNINKNINTYGIFKRVGKMLYFA